MSTREMTAWLTGGIGLVVFWIVLLIATRKHPWALVIGEDGRPSTSKFQMFVWTAAVVFAFLAIFELRFASGFHDGLPGFPTNLLIAMGISVVTAVTAKSIAVNSQYGDVAGPPPVEAQPSEGPVAPPTAAPQQAGNSKPVGGIFTADDGRPDLGKVQLVLWTVIAVSVFLSQVYATVHSAAAPQALSSIATLSLPDIGSTLMVLMGLGHGAYIGKKIAES